ncbi:MAG: hypothetical protein JNL73_15670 [Anaerolineales bacterium]|nr:hypothetical protein [Anaerolineales bacterium]
MWKVLAMLFALIRIGLALSLAWSIPAKARAQSNEPAVCAVLFYSPTCPHCHDVIQNTLLPLTETYGGALQILAVDVSNQAGQDLFNAALHRFAVPEERTGVPMLFVGERVLVGSGEIPDQFPALVEAHLSRGGVGCPEIPGLAASMAASSETTSEGASTTDAAPAESASLPETTAPGIATAMAQDPVGNGLALVVLVAMLISGAWVVVTRRYLHYAAETPARERTILVLCLIGMAVAAYLAYVETAQVPAMCGPVGDCNTVQQSAYARLFGILPVGWLGVIGYFGILGASLVATPRARLIRFGLVVAGLLFSIYLTFLEPFVIGASCAWCLTSAVIMTVLLWLTAVPPSTPRRSRPQVA